MKTLRYNREVKRTPRRSRKYWCGKCDRKLVYGWSKCPVCGYRNGRKRSKK